MSGACYNTNEYDEISAERDKGGYIMTKNKVIIMLFIITMVVFSATALAEICADGQHDMGEWGYAKEEDKATCETRGLLTRTCKRCAYSETKIEEATGHMTDGILWGSKDDDKTWTIVIEPGHGKKGTGKRKCDKCGTQEASVLQMTSDHSFPSFQTWVNGTRIFENVSGASGYFQCGAMAFSSSVDTDVCAYEIITAANCATGAAGRVYVYCQADFCVEKREQSYTLRHLKVEDADVAATCLNTGKTGGYHCWYCGTQLVEPTITPATGHSFTKLTSKTFDTYASAFKTEFTIANYVNGMTVKDGKLEGQNVLVNRAATCTTAGYQWYFCTSCGHLWLNQIAELGHDYGINPKAIDGKYYYGCDREGCGEILSMNALEAQNFTAQLKAEKAQAEKESKLAAKIDAINYKATQISKGGTSSASTMPNTNVAMVPNFALCLGALASALGCAALKIRSRRK